MKSRLVRWLTPCWTLWGKCDPKRNFPRLSETFSGAKRKLMGSRRVAPLIWAWARTCILSAFSISQPAAPWSAASNPQSTKTLLGSVDSLSCQLPPSPLFFFFSFLFSSLSCSLFPVCLPFSLPLCFDPGHLSQVFLTLRCRGLVIRLHWSKSIFQGHRVDHECWELWKALENF